MSYSLFQSIHATYQLKMAVRIAVYITHGRKGVTLKFSSGEDIMV